METPTSNLAKQRWDQEYRIGKYDGERHIPFVDDILDTLKARNLDMGQGLYVGCGNGRNYIPLTDAGLQLTGIDISPEALRQIADRRPNRDSMLVCGDFLNYQPPQPLDYLVSIQVFQHGSLQEAATYFSKTTSLLKPGGLFFLRVNSTATQILHNHQIQENSVDGGKTIQYTDGPKKGLSIHFYTQPELTSLTESFEPIIPLRETTMRRPHPQTGEWVQWEGVWRKKSLADKQI